MNREDVLLNLLAEANPAPDPNAYAIDPQTRARLEAIEQWSTKMQDTELRSVEPMAAPRRTRGWLVAIGTAVLVLLAGFASFALLMDNSEVAATEPTVTFTGAECNYEGPADFDLGAERQFTYVNESDTAGNVAIFRVPDGTTLEDVDPDDIGSVFEGAPGPRSFLNFGADRVEPGGEERFVASPTGSVADEPGEWLVLCFVLERDGTQTTPAGDRLGAIVHVIDN